MTRDGLIKALDRLAELLDEADITLHMYIVGGAAMSLAYIRSPSESTQDIDSVLIHDYENVEPYIRQVGLEQGIDSNWINQDVQNFTDPDEAKRFRGSVVYAKPSLSITGAPPAFLLALKMRACRDKDHEDIALLMELMGMIGVHQAIDHMKTIFPSHRLNFEKVKALQEFLKNRDKEPSDDPSE